MKKSPAPLFLMLRLILSIQFALQAVISTFIYILLVFIASNFKMLINILFLHYAFSLKTEVLMFSFWGFFHSSNSLSMTLIFFVAVLFGINTAFILSRSRIGQLSKKNRKITAIAGTVSLFASGCTICGISLFSTIGAGSFFAVLPIHGPEISVVTLIILSIALYFNLKSQLQPCALPKKR